VQYLVSVESVETGPLLPPEQVIGIIRGAVLPSLEALVRMESEGKILGGGAPVGERSAAFIVEADSNDELHGLLQDLPGWGIVKTKVTPLQRFENRLEHTRQFADRMESSLPR
jgi:muconolactone delta-isomerase